MTIENQTFSMYQGTDQTARLRLLKSDGIALADVTDAGFMLTRNGSAVLTKAFGVMTVSEDATYVYVSCPIVPADTSSLEGVYGFEFKATIAGGIDQRATGDWTIKAAVST